MTKKLDFDGNGLSNLPSIAVTIVIVVAIIDITASRYRRAARGGRCAARTGARSGGRLPGTARGVIPHSSIVAHPVKTAFLGVRIGVRPQRKVTPNLAPFLPLPCYCGYCCAGYNGANCLGSLLALSCVVNHPVQRKQQRECCAWAKLGAPFSLKSALVDLLAGRPPDQLVCTLTSHFCSGCARRVYSGQFSGSWLCPRLGI